MKERRWKEGKRYALIHLAESLLPENKELVPKRRSVNFANVPSQAIDDASCSRIFYSFEENRQDLTLIACEINALECIFFTISLNWRIPNEITRRFAWARSLFEDAVPFDTTFDIRKYTHTHTHICALMTLSREECERSRALNASTARTVGPTR